MNDKHLNVPHTPLYIPVSTVVTMLEEELANRIGHKAPVRDLYVRSVNIGPALYINVENHYGRVEEAKMISDDPQDVELFRCIESLKKIFK